MNSKSRQMKQDKLQHTGWKTVPLGQNRSNGRINPVKGFTAFVRDRNLDDFLKKSSAAVTPTPDKSRVSSMGSAPALGNPEERQTPTPFGTGRQILPSLASFEDYPSFMAARPDRPCILIGFDTEWQNLGSCGRTMLSWQFAVVWDRRLVEFCILKDGVKNLDLEFALGFILDYLGMVSVDERKITRYSYCSSWNDGKPVVSVTDSLQTARNRCCYVYRGGNSDGGFTDELISEMGDRYMTRGGRDWAYFHKYVDYSLADPIHVTLLCHVGKVDLSGLGGDRYVFEHLTEVQGGLVSLQPVRLTPRSLRNVNNKHIYPVSLSIADTMCHAPAGHKKLEDLGKVVGIEKIDIPDSQKDQMQQFLEDDPAGFMEYASQDSVVTLMYASALYGYNNTPPVTITSAAASVMKKNMMEYLGMESDDTAGFNRVYRGLEKISHGKFKFPDRPGYCENTSFEEISDKAHIIQDYASKAYHGGYNGCSEVGCFPFETHDYDLQNAYPTAMCIVPDIDWEDPVKFHVQERSMDLRMFQASGDSFNPVAPFVGYCRFRFPSSVKFPCIPVNVDGVPVYPRSSDGLNGVYVAGPYIYLALQLGAEVYCENGYFLNSLLNPDGHESRCLSHAVLQFVRDRSRASAEHGKKSLESQTLKTMVNSGYGKTAQNVVPKHTWSAYKNMMDDLGCSDVTNPVSAMMTTSIVQCVLLACQNQLHSLGFMSCSVTTDGFISDCPGDVLSDLSLYGFRPVMEAARLFLTDGKDPMLWEEKHHQDGLLNFTTRGNVSLLPCGVCAHNSAKSGFESDSYEDRLWLMTQVLSRTGPVVCVDDKWTSFKDMVREKVDFRVCTRTRRLRMDFDLKRKPDRDSFKTDRPVIEGVAYEIAHFDTVPFENVAEFRLYRKKKELCECLRTVKEWNLFFVKVDTDGCSGVIKDLDWKILTSIVIGYITGKLDIPALDGKTIPEKCAWINLHNNSGTQFKVENWKNLRKKERQKNVLPMELLKDKLKELRNSD